MSKKAVSLLFVVLLMTGCQGNIKPSDPVLPVVTDDSTSAEQEPLATSEVEKHASDTEKYHSAPAQSKALTAAQQITQRLIEQGEQALVEKRLLTPEDDNANLYFQAALGRDPGNFKAIQGIAAIVDLYVQWAWEAAQSGNASHSERYLNFARTVNPHDVVIEEMAKRLKDLQAKREQESKMAEENKPAKILKEGQYLLPKDLFSLSEDEIITKIQPIIDSVAQTQDELAIYWPNDKEARLIYQIINSRVPDFRVRAMIYHRADYRVELQQD